MSATKHTKGPWRLSIDKPNKQGRELNYYITTDYQPGGLCDGSRTIAMICGMKRTEPNALEANLANAHLLAAAPELLEALEVLQQWVYDNSADPACTEPLLKARAALAKAKPQ